MRRACLLLLAACGGSHVATSPPANVSAAPKESAEITALRAKLAAHPDPSAVLGLHAQLGDALWRASCPSATDGLCLTITPSSANPASCAHAPHDRRVALARGDQAIEAASEMHAVFTIAEHGDAEPADAHAVALAYLEHADGAAEAFFANTPPQGSTSSNPDTFKVVMQWAEVARRDLKVATDAYEKILALHQDPDVSVEAIARIGLLYDTFADEIDDIPAPAGLDGAQHTAYCDGLDQSVQQMRAKATEAWQQCADVAQTMHAGAHWAALCNAHLTQTATAPAGATP